LSKLVPNTHLIITASNTTKQQQQQQQQQQHQTNNNTTTTKQQQTTGITAFRRLRKTDSNRLARACGATICHRTDELRASDVGGRCGLMEVRKLGDEYFVFFEKCKVRLCCCCCVFLSLSLLLSLSLSLSLSLVITLTTTTQRQDPQACTLLLRGASKDVLNELERNLHDALAVAKTLIRSPKIVPGGGAAEMSASVAVAAKVCCCCCCCCCYSL
jgi:T-complex protein 1 subunit gamma